MDNFISDTEFLKLDKKVQEVFIEWWKPGIGDLVHCDAFGIGAITENTNVGYELSFVLNRLDKFIPLLQMHQLISFIEEKTGGILDISYDKNINCGYDIHVYDNNVMLIEQRMRLGHNRLKALWKVAVRVVEESLEGK